MCNRKTRAKAVEEATEKLLTIAEKYPWSRWVSKKLKKNLEWRAESVEKRLEYALVKGITAYMDQIRKSPLNSTRPLDVIEATGSAGINAHQWLYFSAGKCFLPQVVKWAVMKQAVGVRNPLIEAEKPRLKPKVKSSWLRKRRCTRYGKNIVGVVLGCNGYDIVDLGVMVPCEKILQTAIDEKVDIITVCLV